MSTLAWDSQYTHALIHNNAKSHTEAHKALTVSIRPRAFIVMVDPS